MNNRAARLVGPQLQLRRLALPRMPKRQRVCRSACRPVPTPTPGTSCIDHRRMLRLTASHTRLLETRPRRWEVPMLRDRVTEFHYITPIANLSSIVTHGVLSHNLAVRLPHTSVALESVQDLRARKRVPQCRQLHDYANLYFDARNAMMYKLKYNDVPLSVIRVESTILDLPDSVITDGNAASTDTSCLAPAD